MTSHMGGTHCQKISFTITNQTSERKTPRKTCVCVGGGGVKRVGTMLTRICIGPTRLTCVHLLRAEDVPQCTHCNQIEC